MLLFVYGDDHLRVKERTEDLKQKFLEKFDPTGMNVDDFVIRDSSIPDVGDILQATQAAPFLSEKRLVVIRGLVEALKKADSKAWVEGFLRTPPSTVILFSDDLGVADFEKKELAKALSSVPDAHRYPMAKLEGSELVSWAKERVLKLGLIITPSLLQDIFARTKDDAWRINAELDKLSAYANGEPVTQAMIDLLVRADSEADIFAFMDALASSSPPNPLSKGEGGAKRALEKLQNERNSGADDFQLYGMLLRQLRLLIQARSIIDANPKANKDMLASIMKVLPFVAGKLMSEVKSWTSSDLSETHALALKLDKAMKSGIKSEISVDRLVSEWLV